MELQQLSARSQVSTEHGGDDDAQGTDTKPVAAETSKVSAGSGSSNEGSSSSSSSDSEGEAEFHSENVAKPKAPQRRGVQLLAPWAGVVSYGLLGIGPAVWLLLLALRTDEQGMVLKPGFVFFSYLGAYVLLAAAKHLKSSRPLPCLAANLGPASLYTKLAASALVLIFLGWALAIGGSAPAAQLPQVAANCFTLDDLGLSFNAVKYVRELCPNTDYAMQLRAGMDSASVSTFFEGFGLVLQLVAQDFMGSNSQERVACYNTTVDLICNSFLPPCQSDSCASMMPCRSTCQIGSEQGQCGYDETDIVSQLSSGFPESVAGRNLELIFGDSDALSLVLGIFYTLATGCENICQPGGRLLCSEEGSVCSPLLASFQCLNMTSGLPCPACAAQGSKLRGTFTRMVGVRADADGGNSSLISEPTQGGDEQACRQHCLENPNCQSLSFDVVGQSCSLFSANSFQMAVKGRAQSARFSDLVGPRVRQDLPLIFNMPSLFGGEGLEGAADPTQRGSSSCFDGRHASLPPAASSPCTRQGQAAAAAGRGGEQKTASSSSATEHTTLAVGFFLASALLSLLSHGYLGQRKPLSPFRLPRPIFLRTLSVAAPCTVLAATAIGMCAEAQRQAAARGAQGLTLPLALAFLPTLYAVRCCLQCWEFMFFTPAKRSKADTGRQARRGSSCWQRWRFGRAVSSLNTRKNVVKSWYARNLSTTGKYGLHALACREVVEIVVQMYSLGFLATEIDFSFVLLGGCVMGFNNIIAPILLYVRPTVALVTDLSIEAFFLIFNLATAPEGALTDAGFVLGLGVPTLAAARGLREISLLWHEQVHVGGDTIRLSRATTLIARPTPAPGSRPWLWRAAQVGGALTVTSGFALILYLLISVTETLKECQAMTGGLMQGDDGAGGAYPTVLFGDSLFDPKCSPHKAAELEVGASGAKLSSDLALFSGLQTLRLLGGESGGGEALLEVPAECLGTLSGLAQLDVAEGMLLDLPWDGALCGSGAWAGSVGRLRGEEAMCAAGESLEMLWAAVKVAAPSTKRLNLAGNALNSLEEMPRMPVLAWLNVSHNRLSSLPALQCPLLQQLHADSNLLDELWPEPQAGTATAHSLRELTLSHNLLSELPPHVTGSIDRSVEQWERQWKDQGLLRQEEEARIDLSFNRLQVIQVSSKASFFKRGRIELTGNGLVWFGLDTFYPVDPDWLLEQLSSAADSLKVLEVYFLVKDSLIDVRVEDLQFNYTALCRFHQLQALHAGAYWTKVPDCIGELQNLQYLHLENLRVELHFPASFCELRSLQFLNIQLGSNEDLSHHFPSCVNASSLPGLVNIDLSGNRQIGHEILNNLVWAHPRLEFVNLIDIKGLVIPPDVCSEPGKLSQLRYLSMSHTERFPAALQNCSLIERIDIRDSAATVSFQLNLTEMPCLRCSLIDGSSKWRAGSGGTDVELRRLMKPTEDELQEYNLWTPARTSSCTADRDYLGCFSTPQQAKWLYCSADSEAERLPGLESAQFMHPDVCPTLVAELLELQHNQTTGLLL